MNVVSFNGRFDDAALTALFTDNAAPTLDAIATAKAELPMRLLAAADFIADNPVEADKYVREQDAFLPIRAMMEQHSWTYCGSGYYSAAFFKAGLVIKIGFKPEDSALLYAAWCRANQGRAGVPVIYKMAANGCAYALLMDRLEAIAGELDKEGIDGVTCFDPILASEFEAIETVVNLGVDGWTGGHKALCQTAMMIREFFMDIANFDVHSGNVMLDRLGNIIITDPVSFVGDTLSGEGYNEVGYAQAA